MSKGSVIEGSGEEDMFLVSDVLYYMLLGFLRER